MVTSEERTQTQKATSTHNALVRKVWLVIAECTVFIVSQMTTDAQSLMEKLNTVSTRFEESAAQWNTKQLQMEQEIKVLHEANQGAPEAMLLVTCFG